MFRLNYCFLYCLVFILTSSCYGTYAPTPRLNHAGAPAHFKKGELEAGASVLATNYGGGAHLGVDYAPADWLRVETGGEWLYDILAMGYVGARFVPYPLSRQEGINKLLLDIELGGALGAGGFDEEFLTEGEIAQGKKSEGIKGYEHFAGGGYLGFGLGLNNKNIDFYMKVRGQVSAAEKLPNTYWVSFVGGIQLNFEKVRIYLDHGPAIFLNSENIYMLHTAELGIRLFFDMLPDN